MASKRLLPAVLCAAGGVALAAGAALGHVGNHLVNSVLVRDDFADPSDKAQELAHRLGSKPAREMRIYQENTAALVKSYHDQWLADVEVQKVTIPADDYRITLAGFIYPAAQPSKKWVMIHHGYTGTHEEMEGYGYLFAQRGYNVLIPDLRSHGESGGTYIGMGWPERLDAIHWMNYLFERYGRDISVVLHGHSMGAATALLAAAEATPVQLKAVIADCSYTSAWEFFKIMLPKEFSLPAHPLLDSARAVFKARSGIDIKKAAPAANLVRTQVPCLFIHGGSDDVIPPQMSVALYACCVSPIKQLHIISGADHAASFAKDPEAYFTLVDRFLARVDEASSESEETPEDAKAAS